jgi:serine/threonine protein phosphatase PrpC
LEHVLKFTLLVIPAMKITLVVIAALIVFLGVRKVHEVVNRISIRQELGDFLLAIRDYVVAGRPDAAGLPPGGTGTDVADYWQEAAEDATSATVADDGDSPTDTGPSDGMRAVDKAPSAEPVARPAGTAGYSLPDADADADTGGIVPGRAVAALGDPELGDFLGHSVADLPPRGSNRPVAWLKAVRGVGLDLLLTRDEIIVGRSSQCDIVIQKNTVSRKHCILLFRSGKWFIQSFDTPNGTFVNDEPVPYRRFVQLGSQDVINIGRDIALRLTMPQDEQAALQLHVGAATARGGRDRNEDHYLAGPRTIGVADGVGGRPGGALASKIAIDMLRGAPEELSLGEFVPAIHAAVQSRGLNDPAAENMATTLDAARLAEQEGRYLMSGIHIGDGVAMMDDGIRLRLLTTAHTLGAHLSNQDNPASKHHPDRSRLLRALGMHKDADADTWDERAVPGNRYVLTTDGLIDALGMDRFSECVLGMRGSDPQQLADRLVDSGLRASGIPAKGIDNLTVVVADIARMPIRSDGDIPRNTAVSRLELPYLPARR